MLRSLHAARLQLTQMESRGDAPIAVLYLPAAARDRVLVRDRLTRAGAAVTLAVDTSDALQMMSSRRYGMIMVDLAGERSAVAAIRTIRTHFPGIPVTAVMNPADPVSSVEALDAGAADVLPWPFDERDAMTSLAIARDRIAIAPDVDRAGQHDDLFVHSPAMRRVADAVRAAAHGRAPVLLSGEIGSGRSLVARTLHAMGHEFIHKPFVFVDCSKKADLERKLFGVVDSQRATGYGSREHVRRHSAIIAAQGGTLFLSNVTDASSRVQARLAGVLRCREVFSIDASEMIPLDIRFIGSLETGVDAAIDDGSLHRDLAQCLGSIRIAVPPFNRRREDLPLLAALFLSRACEAERCRQKCFSRAALSLMSALPWKGNAREMQELISRVVRATQGPVVQLDDVLAQASFDGGSATTEPVGTLREARTRFERACISATLTRHQGRMGDAAKALGIQRTNLYRKVRQLRIPRKLIVAIVFVLGLGVHSTLARQATGTIGGKLTDEARQPYSDYSVQLRDVTTGEVAGKRPLDLQGVFSFSGVAIGGTYLVELFQARDRRVICTEGPHVLTPTLTVKTDVSISCGKAPAGLWILAAGAGTAAAIPVAVHSVSR